MTKQTEKKKLQIKIPAIPGSRSYWVEYQSPRNFSLREMREIVRKMPKDFRIVVMVPKVIYPKQKRKGRG